jgi:hypothetical protein
MKGSVGQFTAVQKNLEAGAKELKIAIELSPDLNWQSKALIEGNIKMLTNYAKALSKLVNDTMIEI